MDARLLFPKEYLSAPDLQGRDVVLTISKLQSEKLRTEDGGKESKWIIHFAEMEARCRKDKTALNKRLVLNVTNAKTIAKLYGNETNDWIGKKIALYSTQCQAFGETVDCIRIRDQKPGAKATSNAETIPHDTTDEGPEPPPDYETPGADAS